MAANNSVAAYSRFVRILKIALPLVAVALLSTIFLVQEEEGLDGGLVFSKADLETLGDGLTVNNPRLAGTMPDGTAYVLSAEKAVPDRTRIEQVEFESLSSVMRFQSDEVVEVHAARATAFVKDRMLSMRDGINIRMSSGYVATSDAAKVFLDRGEIVTDAPVSATGPGTKIDAGRMTVRAAIDANGTRTDNPVVIFEQGVTMTITPPKSP